jgi:capsular polysaccharide transport system permease protein
LSEEKTRTDGTSPAAVTEEASPTQSAAPASDRERANEERLRNWREERARQAEAERQERLKIYEEERQQRLKKLQLEQEQRIADAKARREVEIAAETEAVRERVLRKLPSREALDDAKREILQRRQRQRRAIAWSFMRFVVLPTVLTALYLYLVSTPLYEARSVFAVQTSAEKGGNEISGVIGTTVLSESVKDAFMLREYIESREMMKRLNEEHSFMEAFRSDQMDPIARLYTSNFLQIDEYHYYRRRVHATVDIQQGILRLFVQALGAEETRRISSTILSNAEAHLNQISTVISNQQIALIQQAVLAAEDRLKQAHRNIIELQVERNLIDMLRRRGGQELREEVSAMYQALRNLENRRLSAVRERDALVAAEDSDPARLEQLTAQIAILDEGIADGRSKLVNEEGGGVFNRRRIDLEYATLDKEIALKAWESTLTSLERARETALEQRRYIAVVVPPENPSNPTIPNKLKSVIVVFLVLLGLYVLGSLLSASLRQHGRV